MLVRLGFVVVASVAALTLRRANSGGRHNKDNGQARKREDKARSSEHGEQHEEEREKEEEKEEVKTISGIVNSARSLDDDDDDMLSEIESLLSGDIDIPIPRDRFDVNGRSRYNAYMANEASEIERLHNLVREMEKREAKLEGELTYMANKASEIERLRSLVREMEEREAKLEDKLAYMANEASETERLRSLVREMEEREAKLEGELLEYYGMKEMETDVIELQKQLKIKTVEINMLNDTINSLQEERKNKTVEINMLSDTINSLQEERKKLQDDVARGEVAKKELEVDRSKIKELQRQIQLEAGQTKGQLMLLKQQVIGLKAKEEETAKKEAEVERKLKKLKELEVEVLELRRKNKELLYEKRDLIVKLDVAEGKITESDVVANAREEINKLRHTNEDLTKQVEGLQMNRFSEVEELVYLRWVNACLRFELRNYQTPSGKVSARDLNKTLSPKSQERAKQLMLEYAGSERGHGDTDLESVSSMPSSPGSEDFDNISIDSSSSRYSFLSKRSNLMQKIKKWGRSKDDSSSLASPIGGSPLRKPKGPLEALMLKNAGDGTTITTYGKRDPNDALDDENVASSFQLMSKTVEGFADEKYPAYKDRHKLATEREKTIKEKAGQARAQRFGGGHSSALISSPKGALPPKLAQIKERSPTANAESSEQSSDNQNNTLVVSQMKLANIEKRATRVPRPPPPRSTIASGATNTASGVQTPRAPGAPPPPPPPGKAGGPPPPPPPPGALPRNLGGGDKVHRAPEIVEFYQSLMKREAKKETSLGSMSSNVSDARSNMIGEIENRSTFLLAVKADVETQGEFVESLANEVRAASFVNIDDVVTFVNWLDEELSFLVDERAVLKHFDWPESKTDAIREAAFEYQDLIKLQNKVSSFTDDPQLACEEALKKMYSLLEKVEQSVYALLRTRDMAVSRYKEYGIPFDWLSDSGVVGKIKLASVQLANKYMKRVASELDGLEGTEKEPNREFLLLQGVRFAFRVHQFAGGFDAESMKAFEELRSKMTTQTSAPQISEG
ncbi:protein CHUP1, chloroplastic-like [Miscanthus floridulus]|uniref:protein CHUP1, chloroplastic-like n=1 Tax=Miscanthus floridulus TaxID=154761 RepID=UPI003458F718